MLGKKFLALFITGLMVCAFSSSAFAEFFSVSAGVPVSHSFRDSDTTDSDGISGLMLHAKLPILVGAGLEKYEIKFKDTDVKVDTTMYDLFYLLPVPIVNITLGVGAGQMKVKNAPSSISYDDALATQYYLQLGFPLFVIADIHASYHVVNAKADYTISGGSSGDVDLGSNVVAVGVSVGF